MAFLVLRLGGGLEIPVFISSFCVGIIASVISFQKTEKSSHFIANVKIIISSVFCGVGKSRTDSPGLCFERVSIVRRSYS